jgi:hypothetical protein
MNQRRSGEGLHILWEIITKGIQYRIAEYHAKRCAKGKHSWEEKADFVDRTKCKWCPKTTWRWLAVKHLFKINKP